MGLFPTDGVKEAEFVMEIAGVIQARVASKRCPGKMLRPFAGSTLIEMALRKFVLPHKPERSFPIYLAVREEGFLDIVDRLPYATNCGIIKRDKASVESDDISDVMNYLTEIDAEYILFINACHPFLTLDTIEAAVKHFKHTKDLARRPVSLTSMTFSHTWYYHLDRRPINHAHPSVLDTKMTSPLIRVAHAFHIFPRLRFIKQGFFWTDTMCDPFHYSIPDVEALDVDTELDFEIAEALYLKRGTREIS